MGLVHGAFCLGCCWVLFVMLFPLGIMHLAAMALIALTAFADGPRGLGCACRAIVA